VSIAKLVTTGFSNGSLVGTIPDLVTMGYTIGEEASIWTDKTEVATSWTDQPKESTIWTDKS